MNEQRFRPAWKGLYRDYFVMIAFFVAVTVMSVYFGFHKWLWHALMAAIFYIACIAIYKRNSILLIVNSDKITLERGIMARQSIEISTRNIRTIQVNQSIMQRLLNVGDICVASSGTDVYEITAPAMPNPKEIRDILHLSERSDTDKEENEEPESSA